MSSMRLQLYNRGLVTLSSSSSSPLFILILCEKTAGLFLPFAEAQKLSLHQPTGMRAALQIADGNPTSRVRAGDEIALGICFVEGVCWGVVVVLLDDKRSESNISAHKHGQKHMT